MTGFGSMLYASRFLKTVKGISQTGDDCGTPEIQIEFE
jgi:hypothetical protein